MSLCEIANTFCELFDQNGEFSIGNGWVLLGTVTAFIVTQLVIIVVTVVRANKANVNSVKEEKRAELREQLSQFYYPLETLLKVNEAMSHIRRPVDFIPKGEPNDRRSRERARVLAESAAERRPLIDKSIGVNNLLLEEIFLNKSNFINPSDSIDSYIPLIKHLQMYRIFVEEPFDAYAEYQFPIKVTEHVLSQILAIQKQLKDSQ